MQFTITHIINVNNFAFEARLISFPARLTEKKISEALQKLSQIISAQHNSIFIGSRTSQLKHFVTILLTFRVIRSDNIYVIMSFWAYVDEKKKCLNGKYYAVSEQMLSVSEINHLQIVLSFEVFVVVFWKRARKNVFKWSCYHFELRHAA